MKCVQCGKRKATVFLAHLNHVCLNCAVHLIEKRIRKYVRMNRLIQRNDIIWTTDALAEKITKGIVQDMPVKWLKRKEKVENILKMTKKVKECIKKNRIQKIIIPWTADDEAAAFLKRALENSPRKEMDRRIVPLLVRVTDQEAAILSKYHKAAFSPNKGNEEIKSMLDRMEERYPETKFSLLKSAEKIRELGL